MNQQEMAKQVAFVVRIGKTLKDFAVVEQGSRVVSYTGTEPNMRGAGFYVRFENRRVIITGVWPRFNNFVYAPCDAPRITVSATRSPDEVAAEIARRFLPLYRTAYEKENRACVEAETSQGIARVHAEKLVAILDGEHPRRYGTTEDERRFTASYIDGVSVDGEVHTDIHDGYYHVTVNMTIRSLPYAMAAEIAKRIGS